MVNKKYFIIFLNMMLVCWRIILAVSPTNNFERGDKVKGDDLSAACDKSPVKELLEGKNPFEGESDSGRCEARLAQYLSRKNAIKTAIKCANAKLKKLTNDITKTKSELDALLTNERYKEILQFERESARCHRCIATKCPPSSNFCGSVNNTQPRILPIFSDDIFNGIGDCSLEIDFHQPCLGGGRIRGLRGLVGSINPKICEQCKKYVCCKEEKGKVCIEGAPEFCRFCVDKVKCEDDPPNCCDIVYKRCVDVGWLTNVQGCEKPPKPKPAKTSIHQKLEELILLLLNGKCPSVIEKLPALIQQVKDAKKIPTMPPPTYEELCKDIKVDDINGQPKVDICEEATKKCQPQCTKKEGDKDILDIACFNKCIEEFGCEPK